MKLSSVILLFVFVVCAFNPESNRTTEQKGTPLKLLQTITMPNVDGRIDHMAIDIKGQRLFVAALGNNSVEVVDIAAGKVTHTIKDLHEPQGVAYIKETDRLYVANGESGDCKIYDGATYNPIQTIKLSNDADNVRYDTADKKIYV